MVEVRRGWTGDWTTRIGGSAYVLIAFAILQPQFFCWCEAPLTPQEIENRRRLAERWGHPELPANPPNPQVVAAGQLHLLGFEGVTRSAGSVDIGVEVVAITPGCALAAHGLEVGDELVRIEGPAQSRNIANVDDVREVVSANGGRVTVFFWRSYRFFRTAPMQVPRAINLQQAAPVGAAPPPQIERRYMLGIHVHPQGLPAGWPSRRGRGLMVGAVEPNGAAFAYGLRVGDVVTRFVGAVRSGNSVEYADTFAALQANNGVITIYFWRGDDYYRIRNLRATRVQEGDIPVPFNGVAPQPELVRRGG